MSNSGLRMQTRVIFYDPTGEIPPHEVVINPRYDSMQVLYELVATDTDGKEHIIKQGMMEEMPENLLLFKGFEEGKSDEQPII